MHLNSLHTEKFTFSSVPKPLLLIILLDLHKNQCYSRSFSLHSTNNTKPSGTNRWTVVDVLQITQISSPGKTLTVKRLERRLDCFRTGVGVLAVGGTSIRSSFWLVLGVDGTEEE